MRAAALALALAPLAILGGGCATAQVSIPAVQVPRLQRELAGADRFLRVSMYVTPFFGDETKKLLTPLPPELVFLVHNPDGSAVAPGPVEATWPAGTKVRIVRAEFPSSWTMAERVLYTPRTLVWLYLQRTEAPAGSPPVVVVLRPGIKDEAEFWAEVDHHLTEDNLLERLSAFPASVRQAVAQKRAIEGMSAEALEMAWGFPEAKRIELVQTQRRETWSWGEGARRAVLLDDTVTQVSGP